MFTSGEYSCLRVDFSLKRDLQYFLFHIFLPTSFLVILSWTAFWLEPRASVPRILLGLATLLASASISSDVEASIPHVPYVKAMDLWSAACFMFLLAALLESALVNSIRLPQGDGKNDEGSNSVDMVSARRFTFTPSDSCLIKTIIFLKFTLTQFPIPRKFFFCLIFLLTQLDVQLRLFNRILLLAFSFIVVLSLLEKEKSKTTSTDKPSQNLVILKKSLLNYFMSNFSRTEHQFDLYVVIIHRTE